MTATVALVARPARLAMAFKAVSEPDAEVVIAVGMGDSASDIEYRALSITAAAHLRTFLDHAIKAPKPNWQPPTG